MPTTLATIGIDLVARGKGLAKGLKAAEDRFAASAKKLRSVGKGLTFGVTAPIIAVGAAATKMGADAEIVAAKFNTVFTDAAAAVNAELAQMRDTIPATSDELQSMAADMGDLLKPLGLSTEAAAGMALEIVQLAGDLAAFNPNIATAEEALEKLQSGLVGSYRPLLNFGVSINQAIVVAKALELGLIREGDALSAAARAATVFQLVLEGTTDAQGAAERNAGLLSQQMKLLFADVRQLAGDIGGLLIPVVQPMVERLGEWFSRLNELGPEQKKVIVLVAGLAAAVGPLLVALGSLPLLIKGVSIALTSVNPIFAGITVALIAGVAAWKKWGDDIKRLTRNAVAFVLEKMAFLLEKTVAGFEVLPEQLRPPFVHALEAAAEWSRSTAEQFRSTVDVAEEATSAINAAVGSVPAAAHAAAGALPSAMETVRGELQATADRTTMLNEAVAGLMERFGEAESNLPGVASGTGGLKDAIAAADRAVRTMTASGDDFNASIAAAVSVADTAFNGLGSSVSELFGVFDGIGTSLTELAPAVASAIPMIAALAPAVSTAVGGILNAIGGLFGTSDEEYRRRDRIRKHQELQGIGPRTVYLPGQDPYAEGYEDPYGDDTDDNPNRTQNADMNVTVNVTTENLDAEFGLDRQRTRRVVDGADDSG